MRLDQLRECLDSQNIEKLLSTIDVHRVWLFNEEELALIEVLLRSDSRAAFDLGAFIVAENRRHAAPLVPLLLEISGPRDVSWGNRSFSGSGLRLLIEVLFSNDIHWETAFTARVVAAFQSANLMIRHRTICLILRRFDDIFPELFFETIGSAFEGLEPAVEMLSIAYMANRIVRPTRTEYDVGRYTEFFDRKKRLVSAVYATSLILLESVAVARDKVVTEDCSIFDRLEYFEIVKGMNRKTKLKHDGRRA